MKTMKLILVLATVLSVTNISADVVVTPTNVIGPIKPMNGVNNGPKIEGSDQTTGNSTAYAAAQFPYARTHDASFYAGYGGEHTVDITAIFPDFDKDVNDPKSYDFVLTDQYMKDIMSCGTAVFYRLGQKIEHNKKKYGIYPPKDYKKWARICEHIIRHYNEGWADGLHLGIEYWEIWNEPDLDAWGWDTNPRCWGGTEQQFFEFYEVAANHLNKCFPNLKIGGPAIAGNEEWGERFLDYMEKHNVELDFFSWHIYTNRPTDISEKAARMREAMKRHGYGDKESILNEWNYVRGWSKEFVYSLKAVSSEKGAAFTMATMAACQDQPVDILMYYDARIGTGFNGLFDLYDLSPRPAYFAFYAWKRLLDYGQQVKVENDYEDIYATAAKNNDGKMMIILCRYSEDDNKSSKETYRVRLSEGQISKAIGHLTDEWHRYTEVPLNVSDGAIEVTLWPNSFIAIEM
ncbi:MAG: hypothetical protein IJK21_05895 [Prevotella sp.]|nr:hypothetical protein [Prevotella sp.]